MPTRGITAFAVLVGLSAMGIADEKRPIPDSAAQKAADLIDSIFGERLRRESSSSDQAVLAREILKTGRERIADPVEAYMLFRVARDLAAGAGDIDTALEAIWEIDSAFEVDSDEMLLFVIQKSVMAKTSTDARKHLAQVASKLASEAIGDGRFELANRMITSAFVVARASGDAVTIEGVTKRSIEIAQVMAEYSKVKEALAIVGKPPIDPEASFEVGKFFCFTVGNWEKGLPLLAAGANADLRSIAQFDTSLPLAPQERVELADRWWKRRVSR